MKKIIISLSIIAAAAAVAVGATSAYFSDTETSTGNTFMAGGIDLKIDSMCSWSGGGACPWPQSDWTLTDLQEGVHKFFNFYDIKPGDYGEDTVSVHVFDNDAWARLRIENISDSDNGCVDPENQVDTDCPAGGDGELREALSFWVWLDQGSIPGFQCTERRPSCVRDPMEGNNIWDSDYEPMLIQPGPINEEGEVWNFADGLAAAYQLYRGPGLTEDGHLVGSITYYLGVGWILPYDTGNDVQTDLFGGDMIFEAVQYRNNPNPWQTE